MEFSLSDPLTVLILGGLAFIFFSFVDLDGYQDGKLSFKVPRGSKKYLISFGILIVIVGVFLSMNDSGQQNDGQMIINNTNILTQTITSEQMQNIPIILETSKKDDTDQS